MSIYVYLLKQTDPGYFERPGQKHWDEEFLNHIGFLVW